MSDDNNPAMADASVEHRSDSQVALGQPHLTISRLSLAIQELREKGGSTVSSISKLLRTRGMKARLVDLKKMLIRGVKTGEIARAPQINRFLLKATSTFRSTALNRKRRRSCGRGRRGKSGKMGKGKKARGGGKRQSKKAKKGKAKKGKAKKGKAKKGKAKEDKAKKGKAKTGKAKEGKAKKGRRRPRRRGGKR